MADSEKKILSLQIFFVKCPGVKKKFVKKNSSKSSRPFPITFWREKTPKSVHSCPIPECSRRVSRRVFPTEGYPLTPFILSHTPIFPGGCQTLRGCLEVPKVAGKVRSFQGRLLGVPLNGNYCCRAKRSPLTPSSSSPHSFNFLAHCLPGGPNVRPPPPEPPRPYYPPGALWGLCGPFLKGRRLASGTVN